MDSEYSKCKFIKLDICKPSAVVYFLLDNGSIVYIGQSINVMSRISAHFSCKTFDSVFYINVDIDDIDYIEGALIRKHNPKYNCVSCAYGDHSCDDMYIYKYMGEYNEEAGC